LAIHVQLVGGGELDVAPGVGEQLGELGLLRAEVHGRGAEPPEQAAGALAATLAAAADDLRQRAQLHHRPALGDPFGAEGDVHVAAGLGDQLLHQRGDPRVDGAAQHQQLPVHQVLGAPAQRPRDGARVGVLVLVHRGAEHHHNVLGPADRGRVGGGREEAVGDHPLQHRRRPRLLERHGGVVDQLHGAVADVVEQHRGAAVGERQAEREADVPAAADEDHVDGEPQPLSPSSSRTARSSHSEGCAEM
jgi:hypothetical protein